MLTASRSCFQDGLPLGCRQRIIPAGSPLAILPDPGRRWVLNDPPERLKRAVGSISPDKGYLGLTPKLVDAIKAGALPYYRDEDHWSPEGHKIAAEAITDYLLSPQKQSLPK